MTQIISDIRILDNLLALNLDISLWSARKKMTVEDFGGAELPPEDLASLGSKRIADPSSLKIFSTLKARAFSFLDRHGVRFMSGWANPGRESWCHHPGTSGHPRRIPAGKRSIPGGL